MAFDSLTEKLQNIFKNLRGKGRLTEDDVKEAMREIKRASWRRTSTSRWSRTLSKMYRSGRWARM